MGVVPKLVKVVSEWNIIVKFQRPFDIRLQVNDVVGDQAKHTIEKHLTTGWDNHINEQ